MVNPTGMFFVYAGQYQPDAALMLQETEPPAYVAVVGKPRTYETDDGTVNISLRPEHLTIVDQTTRDRWVSETAERTIERLETFDDEGNEYAVMARKHYWGNVEPYRQAVVKATQSLVDAPTEATGKDSDATGVTPTTQSDEDLGEFEPGAFDADE